MEATRECRTCMSNSLVPVSSKNYDGFDAVKLQCQVCGRTMTVEVENEEKNDDIRR